MTTLAYLSTPFTKYREGHELAFIHAADLTSRLIESGVHAFSPIVHGYPLSEHGNIDPLDAKFWLDFAELFMDRCDVLIVAHMTGWKDSDGIKYETEYFKRKGKPIFDLDPETMKMVRR